MFTADRFGDTCLALDVHIRKIIKLKKIKK